MLCYMILGFIIWYDIGWIFGYVLSATVLCRAMHRHCEGQWLKQKNKQKKNTKVIVSEQEFKCLTGTVASAPALPGIVLYSNPPHLCPSVFHGEAARLAGRNVCRKYTDGGVCPAPGSPRRTSSQASFGPAKIPQKQDDALGSLVSATCVY